MDCREMAELEFAEKLARAMCKKSESDHIQMIYGQWALDAVRVQRVHFELCETCQKQEVKA